MIEGVTDREIEVLRLMTGGFSNREIALALNVVERTVKNRVSNILGKSSVSGTGCVQSFEQSNWDASDLV